MTMRLFAFITVLLIGCSLAAARPSDPCSLTPTVTDAKLTLSTQGNQTAFREGGIIPLALSFTSTVANRYRVADRNYDRSGRLNIDTYCLEPDARDPLADYFSTTFAMGGGLSGEQWLSKESFTATAELNEWKQPGPGHYRLWVVSSRVVRPRDASEAAPDFGVVTLRSNTIQFDVIKADAESRAKQLQEATATYENATPGQQNEAARRLRFLNTKQSTETLARLFWSRNDQPGGWDIMFGLFSSPYRTEAIAALQSEINNPEHPITRDFLESFTKLQVVPDAPVKSPSEYDAAVLQEWMKSLDRMASHQREMTKAALAATMAALPQKRGRAHAITLLTLATDRSDLLDKETTSRIQRQLIADWGNLPEKAREDLIQSHWPPLEGPEALPILREIVSHPAPHFDYENEGAFTCWGLTESQCSVVTTRNDALKRIFDHDPAEGRSLIQRELSDPKARPSILLVKLLSLEEVRPIVRRAVQRIESGEARHWDYSIVEMFGDESALKSLEARFKANNDDPKRNCFPYAVPMLRYFLRVDPKFAAREVQVSLDARKAAGCYPTLFEDLGASLPKVEQLAISALDDPDAEVSTSAAQALGRWGSAKAEPALWGRLKRFHEEWHDREGELRITPDISDPIARATLLERTLLASIVSGTNWICGPKELNQLRALTSRQNWSNITHWTEVWEEGQPWILEPFWGPDDQLTFSVLQYSNLDETQIRMKLSQLPRGSRLYFQTYTGQQMSSPISMEKQQALLQGLRKHALQFGVSIEERPR
jgi:hypothetical protein